MNMGWAYSSLKQGALFTDLVIEKEYELRLAAASEDATVIVQGMLLKFLALFTLHRLV